jgi:hypothetical protein
MSIPWLIQVALEGQTHARREWDEVEAQSSHDAVIAWLNAHPEAGHTLRLLVAPASPLLRHPGGMPMFSREFRVTPA